MQTNEVQVMNVMAVSILDDNADPNKEVLSKEDSKWDFWGDEE